MSQLVRYNRISAGSLKPYLSWFIITMSQQVRYNHISAGSL